MPAPPHPRASGARSSYIESAIVHGTETSVREAPPLPPPPSGHRHSRPCRAGPARLFCAPAPRCSLLSRSLSCLVAALAVGCHGRRMQFGRRSSLGSGAGPSRLSSAAARKSFIFACALNYGTLNSLPFFFCLLFAGKARLSLAAAALSTSWVRRV